MAEKTKKNNSLKTESALLEPITPTPQITQKEGTKQQQKQPNVFVTFED